MEIVRHERTQILLYVASQMGTMTSDFCLRDFQTPVQANVVQSGQEQQITL